MREILILGKQGQIAWELQVTLATLGNITVLGSQELDLADPDAIATKIRQLKPDLIVNAAAYTAVDKAEQEPELCQAINATAPGILAELARESQALLVHYSTEYVFNGQKTSPYLETDLPQPLGVYGASKLAGERAIMQADCQHLILRTTWVYGNRGKNFLLTILRLAAERAELKIVADQVGAPTWSRSIAEATAQILAQCNPEREVRGIYNLSAAGKTSWHGFASQIVNLYRLAYPDRHLAVENILAIPASDYPTPAQRPAYSVLDNSKVLADFGVQLPAWDASLEQLFARW
ncbi:dTDP-4-dehydrorhamnose reductase [Chamaesiphon sp. GL140_3_metabinner_50]|uniref:dTDP-4-dehydrorhamnose reductase n=1 Tax=Chamaesiphon sp. GL140_3_metabinner_50 TaxID=2970812 RepID=UPI0025E5E046|nr:dTDP-4-dehydrorhamnose reductase [Chamaesiphon sp. GL140_3_metabinner_50]